MTNQPKGKGLLIAEKKSAKDDIQKIYEKHKNEFPFQLDFSNFAGHVVELPMPGDIKDEWKLWKLENLPMVPEKWQYQVNQDKKSFYDNVYSMLKKGNYDFIINAGDFEREGQLIQDAFFETLEPNLKTIPIYRLWSNDLQDESVVNALKNLLMENDNLPNSGTVKNLSDAAFLRARFDWLLGLNTTQLLSLKAETKIASGRVQMPVLKIIIDRELEIKNFKPKTFWTIKATFKTDEGYEYTGTLVDNENKIIQFDTKESAEEIYNQISGKGFISEYSKKVAREKAPSFYSMAGLQAAAAKLYNIKLDDSASALQFLYEKKLLSYPRTDSSYISEEESKNLEGILKVVFEHPDLTQYKSLISSELVDQFPKNKSYVDNAKCKAHTALTSVKNSFADLGKLTDLQKKIYYLVVRSILLPFLGDIKKEKTELITEINSFKFKTQGSVILEKGWSQAVPEYTSKDQILPIVNKGDFVDHNNSELKEGKTTPPSRYNTSSLITVMENIHRLLEDKHDKEVLKKAEGLGRPSTRSQILTKIASSGMVELDKKQNFIATDFGIEVIDKIGNRALLSPELTASWESRLQDLEEGLLSPEKLYSEMVEYTKKVCDQLLHLDFELKHKPANKTNNTFEVAGRTIHKAKTGYYDDKFKEYLSDLEEAKKNSLPEPERRGFWLKNKIENAKMVQVGNFSQKDIEKLFSGEIIEKEFAWKDNNNKSKIGLKLNEDSTGVEFVKKNSDRKIESIIVNGKQAVRISGTKSDKTAYSFYKFEDSDVLYNTSIGGVEISVQDLEKLLNGEKITDKFKNKRGEEFDAVLSIKDNKYHFDFPQNNDIYITVNNKPVYKIRSKDKDKVFYKYENIFISEKYSSHKLTKEELNELLTKKELYLTDLVSEKKGTTFSAKLILKNNKIEYEF